MREDTLNRKVYMINSDESVFPCTSSNEMLIWDFNLKVGDTLPSCLIKIFNPVNFGDQKRFVLDSIRQITNQFNLRLNHFYYYGVRMGSCGDLTLNTVKFVEGFGMEDGPIIRRFYTFLDRYCEGTLEQCNIVSSTKESTHSNQLTLLSNPVYDILNIRTDQNIQMSEIIDLNGRTMLNSFEKEINVIDLIPGVYILKCLSDNNKHYVVKFVKM